METCWEDSRVTSRFPFRPASVVGPIALALSGLFTISGCGDLFGVGPLSYVEAERLTTDTNLKEKPDLQKAVRKAMVDLYGPDPQHIKVPEGSGFLHGGIRLANYRDAGNAEKQPIVAQSKGGMKAQQAGGYSLYRTHCLHCHGVSGAGDGPTSAFLFPRPRDYRKGLFKFTSTPTGAKPTRDDLRKTLLNGLHGTSMPAFEAQMSSAEIEQVLDYMIFLSMRGETEGVLIEEAISSGELPSDVVADSAKVVFNKWKTGESQAMNPPIPCPPSSPESVLRGRELFLGLNKTGNKVDCTSCHGPQAIGNGPSIVGQEVFNNVVFGGKISKKFALTSGQLDLLQIISEASPASGGHGSLAPSNPPNFNELTTALKTKLGVDDQAKIETLISKTGYDVLQWGDVSSLAQIVENLVNDLETKSLVSHGSPFTGGRYTAEIDRKTGELWNNSLDEWGTPLRPANLNRGVYKGGRRPIDIYWRIAKGINGAKMPAHYPTLEPSKIWDLVNFVLALPYDASLLEGATLPSAPPAPLPAPAVAGR